MAFCRNCGNQIADNSVVCPYCGVAQNNAPATPAAPADNGGFGWGLLGCCVPIAGLILFLVWKDTKPKSAKAVGIGALVSVGISVVCYLVSLVIGLAAGLM